MCRQQDSIELVSALMCWYAEKPWHTHLTNASIYHKHVPICTILYQKCPIFWLAHYDCCFIWNTVRCHDRETALYVDISVATTPTTVLSAIATRLEVVSGGSIANGKFITDCNVCRMPQHYKPGMQITYLLY